jgi:hypothetical protein
MHHVDRNAGRRYARCFKYRVPPKERTNQRRRTRHNWRTLLSTLT